MRQRAVLQIGVDLLNDRMLAVGLIGRNGIQVTGGEHRVEPVQIKQSRLIDIFFVQLLGSGAPPGGQGPAWASSARRTR